MTLFFLGLVSCEKTELLKQQRSSRKINLFMIMMFQVKITEQFNQTKGGGSSFPVSVLVVEKQDLGWFYKV